MGSISKLINDLDGAGDDEKAQKERLELLLTLAKSKIDKFRTDLDAAFSNPGLINKTQIPGTRAIRYIEQYHVASKTQFDQQVGDHLGHAIDAFFSIGEGSNKAAIQEGLKQVIQTGLSGFIGATEVGESLDRMYFVVPENNAFIRIDVVCWKYHFDQSKILDQHDTAVAYVLCKSVIDHTQITLDELIYLVTQALSSGTFMDADASKNLYAAPTSTDSLKSGLKNLEIEETDPVFQYLTTAGFVKFEANKPVLLPRDNSAIAAGGIDSKREPIEWKSFVSRVLSKDQPFIRDEKGRGADNKDLTYKHLMFSGSLDTATVPIRANPAALSMVESYIDEMVRVWKKLSADR